MEVTTQETMTPMSTLPVTSWVGLLSPFKSNATRAKTSRDLRLSRALIDFQVKVIFLFIAVIFRIFSFDVYGTLVLGFLVFVLPFFFSFEVSLFATEITCCILGGALITIINIFFAPDIGLLSSCFLVSWFWLRLVPLVLEPIPL